MRTVALMAPAAKSDRRTAVKDNFDALSSAVNFHDRRKALADNDAGLNELHPRVRSVAGRLSDVAVKMLEAAVRTQEANPAAAISILPLDAAKTLSVKAEEAEEARSELVRAGYLSRFDNGSGVTGFFVSETNLR